MTEQPKALVLAGGPLGGSLEERARAFQQMGAAAAAGLFPAGYDTPNKVISAAWMADALMMHPGRYMAGVDVAAHGNKLLKFPKWEFEHGILIERLPGYRMKVHQNDEKAADIELFAEGRDSQRYRLTIEDARRRKWTEKDGWMLNVEDHLYAKCYHRVAKRLAADVLMGVVPASDDPREVEVEVLQEEPETPAVEGVRVASRSGAVVIEDEPEAADPRGRLDAEIRRVYGRQDVDVRLEKIALLLAEALKSEGLAAPDFKFRRLSEVGPVDADRVLAYIAKKWPVGATAAAVAQTVGPSPEVTTTAPSDPPGSEPRASSEKGIAGQVEAAPPLPAADAAPPAERLPRHANRQPEPEKAPPMEAPPAPQEPETAGVSWTEFAGLVKQARGAHKGREFIKEAPPGSGRWWFVDKPLLDMANEAASVCIYRDGKVDKPLEWWADRLRELVVKS